MDVKMENQQITAGDLRALGVELDEAIPDLASVTASDVRVTGGAHPPRQHANMSHFAADVQLTARLQWFEVTFDDDKGVG